MATQIKRYPLLDKISFPSDLRMLHERALPQLCAELRAYLVDTISRCGGHFAAGLGAIELTVALHYVYDTPNDQLIWDVGHQCYPHKILTGRKDSISTIRTVGGLAPFPTREESEYDVFGVGHSSTSISAALGIAQAARLQGNNARQVVAIIGDGGMTAGMAYEALNHLGTLQTDMLVILNDNTMSISPNVGALTDYLTRILSSKIYVSTLESGKRLLKPMPPLGKLARRTKEHLKGMLVPGTLFEEMNVRYLGPVDGHNVISMVRTLSNLKTAPQRAKLLHVITHKGEGYAPAEKDPVRYHAVGRFKSNRGLEKSTSPSQPTYTEVFSDWICRAAETCPTLVAITPAMREGSGLVEFEKRFPDRYFDVGIAEQHALTLAAGMAVGGLRPVVAIYSTFLQRAYDQLIHDVAIQNLPVILAVDRAGLVGPDGKTHAGSFDLCFLRCIPNMMIMCPSHERALTEMLNTALAHPGPCAIRYPRGKGPGIANWVSEKTVAIGTAAVQMKGKDIAILSFGSTLTEAEEAASELGASLIDMRFVKPLDEKMVVSLVSQHTLLVTVEDGARAGGAGSAVNECLARHKLQMPVLNLGLPDYFLEHGSREELLCQAGLQAAGIVKATLDYQQSTA